MSEKEFPNITCSRCGEMMHYNILGIAHPRGYVHTKTHDRKCATPEESSAVPTTSTDRTEVHGPEVLNPTRLLPGVKESSAPQIDPIDAKETADNRYDDMTPLLTPEQRLALLLDAAMDSACYSSVPRWMVGRLNDDRVKNMLAHRQAFEDFAMAKSGQLETELADAIRERDQLREIIAASVAALGTGATCAKDASLGFMADVPIEVRLTTQKLRAQVERLRELCEASDELQQHIDLPWSADKAFEHKRNRVGSRFHKALAAYRESTKPSANLDHLRDATKMIADNPSAGGPDQNEQNTSQVVDDNPSKGPGEKPGSGGEIGT